MSDFLVFHNIVFSQVLVTPGCVFFVFDVFPLWMLFFHLSPCAMGGGGASGHFWKEAPASPVSVSREGTCERGPTRPVAKGAGVGLAACLALPR